MENPNFASMLSQDDICASLKFSRTKLLTLRKAGEFPAPMRLSARVFRWPAEQVAAWAESRAAASRAAVRSAKVSAV